MGKQREQWQTPVRLPGKFHGWRSLEGCRPWGRWGSDTTERLHFHFSLSFIGEGNGNPLQYSCLESPRNGGAWWAAIYGVAQSRTRLKWLSSSSSSHIWMWDLDYKESWVLKNWCFWTIVLEKTLHMDITRWSTPKSGWLYSLQPKMEKLYTVSKNKTRNWLWLKSWTPYCQI